MQENLNSQKSATGLPFKISDDILRELDKALGEETKVKNYTETKADELDFDFDFLPLTNGLGFHQAEEKKAQAQFSNKKVRKPSTPFLNQSIAIKLETDNQNPNRADLSPFYNSNTKSSFDLNPLFSDSDFQKLKATSYKKNEIVNEIKVIEEKVFERAQLQDQIAAWAIDLLVINVLLMTTIYLNFALSGYYQIDKIVNLISPLEAITYFSPLFIFYYLFYFTLLDSERSATVGKKLMNLEIRSLRGQSLGFSQTFLRAAITLLSSLALGLPLLMDFQGKLTDSEVIKK